MKRVKSEERRVKNGVLCTLCILLVSVFASCEHRQLVEPSNVHYVRVYLDERIQNVTYGFYSEDRLKPQHRRPSVLRVALCEPASGRVVAERYLQQSGEDERGYYLEGHITADAGDYHLMVYNFGTESTLIREEHTYRLAEAYTNEIASHYYAYLPSVRVGASEAPIVYEPDHLFLMTQDRIHIAPTDRMDTLRTDDGDYFTASTCVDSYYIQVRIKGIEYVSTAASLLTGLAASTTLHNRSMQPEPPVRIFFEMNPSGRENVDKRAGGTEEEDAVIYTTFNTFGKLPEVETEYTVTFDFVTTDGRTQTETMNITPMFDTPEVMENKWIIIDKEIVIAPPPKQEGGGLSPEVDEWQDVNTDLQI